MPLITLFSAPKPFTDPHIAMIQRNAIKSWTLLPDVEVILLGDEVGLAEVAKEFRVKHFPNVKVNESGVPLISSMFEIARENSNGELLCIVNADMILMSDFVEAASRSRLQRDKFVLLSQRWDYDITSPLDFAEGWESRLRESVRKQNQLHRPAGSDFFLFTKNCYQDIPNFTIGRAGWDNWMIYKARKEGWAVIDGTPSVMIAHQNHDYSHLPDGKPHYEHPETNENIRLAGGQANVRYTILDATHQLADGKLIRPKMTSLRLTRKLELFLRAIFFFLPEKMIENIARPKRWQKRIQKIGNRKSEIGNRRMRKGQNPAKFVKDVAKPERITVALLNYIPFLSGFYAETLDVLKVSLESMHKDAGLPFDLMVFDNGSCAEVRDFLVKEKEDGRIQYLILSEKNMGKGGAWNVMLAGAPGEIIAYTDSDVLFSPKWLSRSVEILETFPNVGMVTARPFRTPPEFYESTLKWARENTKLEEGQFIPWETFLEFNLSLGQTEEENRKVYAETKDWCIQYKGVTALTGASHWQFTAYKSTLQQFLPFDMDKPMGQVRQLDKRMNDAGLLRLMVSDPLAMNMSNTLGYLRGELGKERGKKKEGLGRRVLEVGFVKKMLLAVYNRIFSWYYS